MSQLDGLSVTHSPTVTRAHPDTPQNTHQMQSQQVHNYPDPYPHTQLQTVQVYNTPHERAVTYRPM